LVVILVAADPSIREAAPGQGANLAITPDALIADFADLVAQHARIPDEAETAQLATECDQPLPPLAVAGIEKFNNREFYPQHDLFEEQWMATEGPVRNLYRAILQVGVAYYQIERGNYRGARKMLLRAVPWLEMLPDACQGVDVAQLRRDAYHVRDVLEATAPDEIDQFDKSLLKPVRMLET
jgi:predicted metal-dependent hydrolase